MYLLLSTELTLSLPLSLSQFQYPNGNKYDGEIVFLKPSTEEVKKISGVWSVHNGVINLAISRTHSSKFAEFTVKNQLYGRIEEAMSTLSAVGKIFCDDLCEDLSQALKSTDTFGSFSLRRIDAHITTKRTDVEELTCA